MADKAEQGAGSIPPDSSVRVDKDQAIQSLEYAIRAVSENAAFAREMSVRARSDGDADSASEYEGEAVECERHAATLSTLAGSLRMVIQIERPQGFRAA